MGFQRKPLATSSGDREGISSHTPVRHSGLALGGHDGDVLEAF
jgi:hypothetical protein